MSDAPGEYSVIIDIDSVPRGGKALSLTPDAAERKAIAARLGAPEVKALEGALNITATSTTIDLRGRLTAQLTRQCVASLEPMEETVEDDFHLDFVRHAAAVADDADLEDWLAAPEVHEGKTLDVGEILVQQLSLAMAPFPRKPDGDSLVEKFGRESALSPFAAALKNSMKNKENQ